jgi:hypothetical protein
MLAAGIHVGVGTDATRVASYDPWNALYWLTTGRTLGGHRLYPQAHCIDRMTALRLYTEANTWFSSEEGQKGRICCGQLADLAVLSDDYFAVPEDGLRHIVSLLTVVGGAVVYAAGPFQVHDRPLPPAMPDWSPVRTYDGYWKPGTAGSPPAGLRRQAAAACGCAQACGVHGHAHARPTAPALDAAGFWGSLGCSCWAF